MEIGSLGFRTDLTLLRWAGSQVEDRGSHVVVRTPDNPGFYWGNYLLLPELPEADDAAGWLAEFERELPDARHRAFGIDGTTGSAADLDAFTALGLTPDVSVVMSATQVREPPRPDRDADHRPLVSDDDWEAQVELSMVGEDEGDWSEEFARPRADACRRLVEAGRGQWWGAFEDGRLLSSMGLYDVGGGLARFQTVKTHPDARGRGLAGTLVHRVSRFGLDELGAHTLVMVADPDYPAIRVYRSVGFDDGEVQLRAERRPPPRR